MVDKGRVEGDGEVEVEVRNMMEVVDSTDAKWVDNHNEGAMASHNAETAVLAGVVGP